ncbi:MAG: hypothetical protein FJY97_07210 [candidate division Zixibacteria bacterium]|nr:hypothetical protein [candidate division Zixibacteria bacterium]
MSSRIPLPPVFPQSDYTPFGYLNNPYHSAVHNPSGIIRTVPPMGFGFWARTLPWPYGSVLQRPRSYLSLLRLSLCIGDTRFHDSADFPAHGVTLCSKYHTQTLMSYDWSYKGIGVSAKYFLADEHSLLCILELDNTTALERVVSVHAANEYGYPDHPYWGCDGIRSFFRPQDGVGVSKIWAYGEVMVIGADRPGRYRAGVSETEWCDRVQTDDSSDNDGALIRFNEGADHLYAMMNWRVVLPSGGAERLVIGITRGVNESDVVDAHRTALRNAEYTARVQLEADTRFYTQTPLLEGDWPDTWKHGWIYDLETLRTTMRPPVGIFKHPWDGMQLPNPRSVLGEMGLDTMCLSYGDVELAKEVIYGTFADAPAPNVPCTREDGSMNMIGESGNECGTAPNWGFPFVIIWSIYLRDRDDRWIERLYPHLRAYLEWWLVHRSDGEGWLHADNSWESGQDGSRRFLNDTEGASAAFVRTVDIEAAMAQAMRTMVHYARIAGYADEADRWDRLAEARVARTQTMIVDGWFRDVDGRTGQPILLPDFVDVMMLTPLTVGVATPEQTAAAARVIPYFREHPRPWLEWPSFVMPFAEAAWRAGMRTFLADTLAEIGDRIYTRQDARTVHSTQGFTDRYLPSGFPEMHNFRIPGVAGEYWPMETEKGVYAGAEHYGWGATFPTSILRHIVGFRESETPDTDAFFLAPALPDRWLEPSRVFGVSNLRYRVARCRVQYHVTPDRTLTVTIHAMLSAPRRVEISDASGRTLAQTDKPGVSVHLRFSAQNGDLYAVTLS